MAVLVMHLLLIRVLEGFAVATVSVQTTHTKAFIHSNTQLYEQFASETVIYNNQSKKLSVKTKN